MKLAFAYLGRSTLEHTGKTAALKLAPNLTREPVSTRRCAIRSVRPAEARPGLAAIVSAVDVAPELAAVVAKYLPELDLMLVGGGE